MTYRKSDFYFVKYSYTTINFENIFKSENRTHYAFMPDSRHLKPISEVTFGKWFDPNHPIMDFSIGYNVSVKHFINSRVREVISIASW